MVHGFDNGDVGMSHDRKYVLLPTMNGKSR